MVHPNAIGCDAMSDFGYQRSTAAVTDQVNREFSQRVTAKVAMAFVWQQHVTRNCRYINGADL